MSVCVKACACTCTQAHLCLSIFIRIAEENPIMIVSVEIKETDLW